MARPSKYRWLLVPAFFATSIFLFIHYSIRLDDTVNSPASNRAGSIPQRNKNRAQGPTTVTVTKKETVTLYRNAPNALSGNGVDGSKHMCDPYSSPGYFSLDEPGAISETVFTPLNSNSCPVFSPSIVSQLLDSKSPNRKLKDSSPTSVKPDLFNKTVIMLGGEIDRDALVYLCSKLGGRLAISEQDSHISIVQPKSDEEPSNGLTGAHARRCYFSDYHLSISHYMVYGVSVTDKDTSIDADTIPNSSNLIQRPFSWESRLKLGAKAFATLPFKAPDLVFVGSGLWDLAYFNKKTSSPQKQLSSDQLKSYSTNFNNFVTRVKEYYPSSRVVVRDTFFPRFGKSAQQASQQTAFDSLKVEQLNSAIQVVAQHNGISFWPIGKLSRSLPSDQVYLDGVHLSKDSSISLLGEGILEYIARTRLTKTI